MVEKFGLTPEQKQEKMSRTISDAELLKGGARYSDEGVLELEQKQIDEIKELNEDERYEVAIKMQDLMDLDKEKLTRNELVKIMSATGISDIKKIGDTIHLNLRGNVPLFKYGREKGDNIISENGNFTEINSPWPAFCCVTSSGRNFSTVRSILDEESFQHDELIRKKKLLADGHKTINWLIAIYNNTEESVMDRENQASMIFWLRVDNYINDLIKGSRFLNNPENKLEVYVSGGEKARTKEMREFFTDYILGGLSGYKYNPGEDEKRDEIFGKK